MPARQKNKSESTNLKGLQMSKEHLVEMILDLHNRLNELSISRLSDAIEDLKKAAEKWQDEECVLTHESREKRPCTKPGCRGTQTLTPMSDRAGVSVGNWWRCDCCLFEDTPEAKEHQAPDELPIPYYPGKHEGDLLAQIIDLHDLAVKKGKTEDIHDAVDAFVSFALGNKHKRLPEHTSGTTLIAIERARQITSEKWTLEHDDTHVQGELGEAAAYYALEAVGGLGQVRWPWDWKFHKEHTRLRKLQIAGALIAAEIDRRIRKGEIL